MTGKPLMIAFLAFTALFGVGLWYAQEHAWWREVSGVASLRIDGRAVPVAGYRGLESAMSPLKLRGCFDVDPDRVVGPPAEGAAPLTAPRWFDCFDAAALGALLEAGQARAVVAEMAPEGFRRVVAVTPDGRGWQWREVLE